jgi:DNA modification methylase
MEVFLFLGNNKSNFIDGETCLENRLNDLNGSEWLFWTNSIYETSFSPDITFSLRKQHGAMKPPQLMADIISFFTKAGEKILDPFAGVGSTLLGAELTGRKAVGIELNPEWIKIYQSIAMTFIIKDGNLIVNNKNGEGRLIQSQMYQGDCLEIMKEIPDQSIAAVITDPPYGCNQGRIGFKKETNFNMNSTDHRDFGNSLNYQEYLFKIKMAGKEIYRILEPDRYLVLLIGDRFDHGEYLPLGTMVAQAFQEIGFKWKGVRIWWNKATQRPLKPYAVKNCFIPNITHQNIIVLRKETKNRPKG